jgi:hypothetical protein
MSSDRDLRQRLLAWTLVAFEVFQGDLRINAGDISGIISSRIERDILTVSAPTVLDLPPTGETHPIDHRWRTKCQVGTPSASE